MAGPHVDEDGVVTACLGLGMRASELRMAAIRLAREIAHESGEPLTATFRDTLSGDVARLQVWRRLRRLFPGVTFAEAEPFLDEVLAP